MTTKNKNTTDDVPAKEEYNAGGAAFNQGVEQDPHYDEGTKISDEEKKTGHIPGFGRENNDAKDVTTVDKDKAGKK